MNSETLLALDVGARRIGVAKADTGTKVAYPIDTLLVDGRELERLKQLIDDTNPRSIVVGYPRNQAGEPTAQTEVANAFAERLRAIWDGPVAFQDESLTSVVAEERLRRRAKPYRKADIDAEAAAIILQDYLEAQYGY